MVAVYTRTSDQEGVREEASSQPYGLYFMRITL